jgi:hypothetical protein
MATVKTFVRAGGQATIICPNCNTAKNAKVNAYLHKKHRLNVRCRCNTVFTVLLEFRKHYRKATNLPGTYVVTNPKGGGGGMAHIQNISRSGIGFSVSGLHRMGLDQTLRIEFNLNDKNFTKVIKEAKIKAINDNYIGCQFLDNQPFEKALGFYLQQ